MSFAIPFSTPAETAVSSARSAPNPAANIVALRALLAEKFPSHERSSSEMLPTGWEAFDRAEGGLRRGALTELAGSLSAGALFVEVMLALVRREKCFAALIDGARTFDAESCPPEALRRLLWVRCDGAAAAMKAADLLLRDGNLPLIIVDLQPLPPRELQRIPANTWHRFQRLVEETGTAFIVLTPRPMVEAAGVRIAVQNTWPLGAMRERRRALLPQLRAQVFNRRNFAAVESAERRRIA